MGLAGDHGPHHPASPPISCSAAITPATVDAKGRLKVPAAFLSRLLEQQGKRLFVTSLDGESVLIYPMPVWEEIEARLRTRGDLDPPKRKFLLNTSFYGHETELDPQGRLLLPQHLRARANTVGKVDVLGKGRCLEAWDHETLAARIESERLTEDEMTHLAQHGI